MEATWNGALFSAATIRLPVSTRCCRSALMEAASQRQPSAVQERQRLHPLEGIVSVF
jgi:hypothetical protein